MIKPERSPSANIPCRRRGRDSEGSEEVNITGAQKIYAKSPLILGRNTLCIQWNSNQAKHHQLPNKIYHGSCNTAFGSKIEEMTGALPTVYCKLLTVLEGVQRINCQRSVHFIPINSMRSTTWSGCSIQLHLTASSGKEKTGARKIYAKATLILGMHTFHITWNGIQAKHHLLPKKIYCGSQNTGFWSEVKKRPALFPRYSVSFVPCRVCFWHWMAYIFKPEQSPSVNLSFRSGGGDSECSDALDSLMNQRKHRRSSHGIP